MQAGAAATRRRQRVEALCAAALRALAGEPALNYRGGWLHRGRRALPPFAPHLHPRVEDDDDFASFRGAADGIALRLRLSDAALHQRLRPAAPVARLVFEMLEQFRVESLADPALPGLARNLRHRFAQWSLGCQRTPLIDTQHGLLLYAVAQMARSRVTGDPVPDAIGELIETPRGLLAPAIGAALTSLRRTRADQAAYATHALAIARHLAGLIVAPAADAESAPTAADGGDDETAALRLLMPPDAPPADGVAVAIPGRSRSFDDASDGYRIFTRAYDRELLSTQMARPQRLRELRATLDARIATSGVHLARLVRQLQALLADPSRDAWHDAEEEGLVDGRRLAQLIASPSQRRLFKREQPERQADAVLAFLLDCSGSMRDHAPALAALADTAARALEMAGVACEILGFTTGGWHGGRAQRDWQRAGRPPQPGRLNERCHLVFKDADTRWRAARPAVAALLEAPLFREGLDGEAVDWACARLLARDERRKLLVVISDGCPMDSATGAANDAHYLDAHLREVVARRERQRRVQIGALGVGLDLSGCYGRSVALDLGSMRSNDLLREWLELLRRLVHRR